MVAIITYFVFIRIFLLVLFVCIFFYKIKKDCQYLRVLNKIHLIWKGIQIVKLISKLKKEQKKVWFWKGRKKYKTTDLKMYEMALTKIKKSFR